MASRPSLLLRCRFVFLLGLLILITSPNGYDASDTSQSSTTSTGSESCASPTIPPQQQQQQHPPKQQPKCLAVDTDFNYLCTYTPDEARRAMTSEYLAQLNAGGSGGASVLAMPAELDLGVAQRIAGSEVERGRIRKVLKKMERYFQEEVLTRAEFEIVRGRCKNHHELCAFWASVGECESNRGFMLSNCAASCRLCLLQHTNMWLE